MTTGTQHHGDEEDKVVLALARANIYNLLASVYAERPSARLVAAIQDGTFAQALHGAGLEEMAAALAAYLLGRDGKELLAEMEVEYTRRFVAPGPGYVPPYQSVYADEVDESDVALSNGGTRRKKQQLWGDAAVSAQRMYAEAGLSLPDELREVPDHVGLELQFMQHLCSREAEARSADRAEATERHVELQMAFLESHLLPWLERFCQAVSRATSHPFYRAMASLTAGFVLADAAELGSELQRSKRTC